MGKNLGQIALHKERVPQGKKTLHKDRVLQEKKALHKERAPQEKTFQEEKNIQGI
ncbi:1217_t:CDS:2 [Racocetra fulgida]|uniref:1217_t:CDS:1 n=1 Tax=Racocetra fulgida TaxID=60492 RepID=A0A9N8Z605_9GLOM|nr:1217_t:CDS:2 [Racocetra fulgida]